MKQSRSVVATVSVLGLTLVLAACGGSKPSQSSQASSSTTASAPTSSASAAVGSSGAATESSTAGLSNKYAGTTIKVLVSSGHQQFNPLWADLSEFQKATGITVQLDKVETTNIASTFLKDVQLGGCTIDNVEMLDGGTAASAPYMQDLTPYFKKDGTSVDQFAANQVDWAVKAMTFNGKLAFYPFYSGAKAIAYRKDLFDNKANQAAFQAKFGYPFPLPPKTPQQLADLAKFFTGNTTKEGIVFSGAGDPGETTMGDLMFRSGVEGYQDDSGNALIGPKHADNQAKVAQAATWLTNLLKSGVAPSSVPAMQTTDTTNYYLAGNAAMLYDHIYLSWSKLTAPSAVSKIGQSGSFEMPDFVQGSGGLPFFWGRGIPSCSKHKDASWEFTKWVMSPQNQELALSKGVGVYVPTDKNVLAWAVQKNLLPQGVADAVTHASYYKITNVTNQLRESVDIPLVEKLIGGQLSPTQYAKQAGDQMQQAVSDAGSK